MVNVYSYITIPLSQDLEEIYSLALQVLEPSSRSSFNRSIARELTISLTAAKLSCSIKVN
jgi:hypothetical protein